MPRDYFRSPEGEAEYKKFGQEYENEMWDNGYEKFLKLTKNTS
jgi:hypothetical protein